MSAPPRSRCHDTQVIQKLLGHADLDTTRCYTHIRAEFLRRIGSPFDVIGAKPHGRSSTSKWPRAATIGAGDGPSVDDRDVARGVITVLADPFTTRDTTRSCCSSRRSPCPRDSDAFGSLGCLERKRLVEQVDAFLATAQLDRVTQVGEPRRFRETKPGLASHCLDRSQADLLRRLELAAQPLYPVPIL